MSRKGKTGMTEAEECKDVRIHCERRCSRSRRCADRLKAWAELKRPRARGVWAADDWNGLGSGGAGRRCRAMRDETM